MAWTEPKIDFTPSDALVPDIFNDINNNIKYIEDENRTPNNSASLTGTGKLSVLLNVIFTMLKNITGKADGHTSPATTLEATKNHIDAAAPHSGHETPAGATTKANAAVTAHAVGGSTHPAVTTSVAGFMSAADKSKLNGIESGATADMTATEIKDALRTVDGPGSDVNADLLDDRHAYDFALASTVDDIIYDNYLRMLELYYTGHYSGQTIDGMRGMFFDGFVDTGDIDTVNTTGVIKTASSGGWVAEASADAGAYASVLNMDCSAIGSVSPATYVGGTMAYAYDGSLVYNANGAWLSIPGDSSSTTLLKFKVGTTAKLLKRIRICKSGSVSWWQGLQNIWYSTLDNPTTNAADWVALDVSSATITDNQYSAPYYFDELMFNIPVNCKWIAFRTYFSTANSSGVNYNFNEVQFQAATLIDSYLYSTTKALVQNEQSFTLYLTVNKGSNNVIPYVSVDGGTSYTQMNLVGSRSDPLTSGYVEEKYICLVASPGNQLKLKFLMDINAQTDVFIKRYDIAWN